MSSVSTGIDLENGAVTGGTVFVIGVVVTLVLGLVGFSNVMEFLVAADAISGTLLGYLGMHTWFLDGGAMPGSFQVLTIVPIVLLLAGGYRAATRSSSTGQPGYTAGASIAIGYLVLTLVALVLMALTGAQISVGGGLVLDIIVTGILFPVVFGAIGGAAAS